MPFSQNFSKSSFDSWLKQFTFKKVDTPPCTGANVPKQHERNMSVDMFYSQKKLMSTFARAGSNITQSTMATIKFIGSIFNRFADHFRFTFGP